MIPASSAASRPIAGRRARKPAAGRGSRPRGTKNPRTPELKPNAHPWAERQARTSRGKLACFAVRGAWRYSGGRRRLTEMPRWSIRPSRYADCTGCVCPSISRDRRFLRYATSREMAGMRRRKKKCFQPQFRPVRSGNEFLQQGHVRRPHGGPRSGARLPPVAQQGFWAIGVLESQFWPTGGGFDTRYG